MRVKPQPWTWGETLLYAAVAALIACGFGFVAWLIMQTY